MEKAHPVSFLNIRHDLMSSGLHALFVKVSHEDIKTWRGICEHNTLFVWVWENPNLGKAIRRFLSSWCVLLLPMVLSVFVSIKLSVCWSVCRENFEHYPTWQGFLLKTKVVTLEVVVVEVEVAPNKYSEVSLPQNYMILLQSDW